MKNQYYGDVNDYVKYAMLRHLVKGSGLQLGINWYLTPEDGSSDGDLTAYLNKPEKWRHLDPDLYDRLRDSLLTHYHRDINRASLDIGLTPAPLFYSEITPDSLTDRMEWLEGSMKALQDAELLFLDPDNGLSVKSTPKGMRKSSKYVYDEELVRYCSGGTRSLIIYQHNKRQSRESLITEAAGRLKSLINPASVITLAAPHVVYFIAATDWHKHALASLSVELQRKWDKVKVRVME